MATGPPTGGAVALADDSGSEYLLTLTDMPNEVLVAIFRHACVASFEQALAGDYNQCVRQMIDLARTCTRFKELFGEFLCLNPINDTVLPLNRAIRLHFAIIQDIVDNKMHTRYQLALVMLVAPLLTQLRHTMQQGICMLVMDMEVKFVPPKQVSTNRQYPATVGHREFVAVMPRTLMFVRQRMSTPLFKEACMGGY